jgi:hypothetical protein
VEIGKKSETIRKSVENLDHQKKDYFCAAEGNGELEPLQTAVTELEEQCEKIEVSLKNFITSYPLLIN